jgi:hypothetical protein
MKKFIVALLTACLFAGNVYAYGPRGHSLVGAVADQRLKKNPAVEKKVSQLLDGLSLANAANLPDRIKSWDSEQDCHNRRFNNAAVPASKRINRELRAFLKANLCSSKRSHHAFHFTDVPVFGSEKYADGEVGREPFDIVKMIPFCLRVLEGKESQPNDFGITRSVAVILLVHYFGDLHQPLHVGAEYFNAAGLPFEPTESDKGFADQGGNKLTLHLLKNGTPVEVGALHSYWDGKTMDAAFGNEADASIAVRLGRDNNTPPHWRPSGDVETWAEKLANEILPVAREAHDRLSFSHVVTKAGRGDIERGDAEEKQSNGKTYANWAGAVVRDQIHKGGWRLAAALEKVLQ